MSHSPSSPRGPITCDDAEAGADLVAPRNSGRSCSGPRVGGDVVVVRGEAEQFVADAPARPQGRNPACWSLRTTSSGELALGHTGQDSRTRGRGSPGLCAAVRFGERDQFGVEGGEVGGEVGVGGVEVGRASGSQTARLGIALGDGRETRARVSAMPSAVAYLTMRSLSIEPADEPRRLRRGEGQERFEGR